MNQSLTLLHSTCKKGVSNYANANWCYLPVNIGEIVYSELTNVMTYWHDDVLVCILYVFCQEYCGKL